MAQASIQWPRSDAPGLHNVELLTGEGSVLIGRNAEASIRIAKDSSVSRPHAEISHVPGAWMIEDVGSRGGTFVVRDGVTRKVNGRERLRDGDMIKVGRTRLKFLSPPADSDGIETELADEDTIALTARELDVLGQLCAHEFAGKGGWPTNAEIAASLVVSTETIKTHIHNLIGKFNLHDVPDRQKRARLVRRSIDEGWVRPPREG